MNLLLLLFVHVAAAGDVWWALRSDNNPTADSNIYQFTHYPEDSCVRINPTLYRKYSCANSIITKEEFSDATCSTSTGTEKFHDGSAVHNTLAAFNLQWQTFHCTELKPVGEFVPRVTTKRTTSGPGVCDAGVGNPWTAYIRTETCNKLGSALSSKWVKTTLTSTAVDIKLFACTDADCSCVATGTPTTYDELCDNILQDTHNRKWQLPVTFTAPVPPASCTDATKNDAETDIDCGGTTCRGCAVNKACVKDADCLGGLACLNKKCAGLPPAVTTSSAVRITFGVWSLLLAAALFC